MHFQYQRLLTPALSNSTASQSSGWTVNTNREAEASCLMGLWEGARADNCWVMSDRKQTFAPIAAWHNEVCSVLIRCQDEFLSILKFWGSADGEAWIFEQSLFCLQLFPVTFELEVQSVFINNSTITELQTNLILSFMAGPHHDADIGMWSNIPAVSLRFTTHSPCKNPWALNENRPLSEHSQSITRAFKDHH